ncbi:hypothetical protein B0H66DRAFT_556121, partial [Apodospora peruviana]
TQPIRVADDDDEEMEDDDNSDDDEDSDDFAVTNQMRCWRLRQQVEIEKERERNSNNWIDAAALQKIVSEAVAKAVEEKVTKAIEEVRKRSRRTVSGGSSNDTGPGTVMGRGHYSRTGTSYEKNTRMIEQEDLGERVGRTGTNPAVSAGDCPGSERASKW